MSDSVSGGNEPSHDASVQSTETTTIDYEAAGRSLVAEKLEGVAIDLREVFMVKSHTEDLDADDVKELFDALDAARQAVGQIAEHTPGAVNEADPYRNLSQEEMEKAIGYASDDEHGTAGEEE